MPGIFYFTGNCFPVRFCASRSVLLGTERTVTISIRNQASSGVHLNFRKKNGILFVAPVRFLYRRDAEEMRKG